MTVLKSTSSKAAMWRRIKELEEKAGQAASRHKTQLASAEDQQHSVERELRDLKVRFENTQGEVQRLSRLCHEMYGFIRAHHEKTETIPPAYDGGVSTVNRSCVFEDRDFEPRF